MNLNIAESKEVSRATMLQSFSLVSILLLAGILRWLRWDQTAVMFNDGPEFLGLAQKMAQGDWSNALSHDYHPLYSFLTLAANFYFNNWELAAVSISIISGVAAVLFLFLFLRDTFGLNVAWLGSIFLAMHYRAVSVSSDIQSDGLYIALFLLSLWLAWRGLERVSPALLGWSGVASGLAYLARPEGLGVAIVTGAMLCIYCLIRRVSISEYSRCSAALVAGVLLLVMPYVLVQRVEHGEFALTQKKSVSQLSGIEVAVTDIVNQFATSDEQMDHVTEIVTSSTISHASQGGLSRRHKVTHAIDEYFAEFFDAFRIEALVPLLFGLYAMRGRPDPRGWLLLTLTVFYSAVLLSLAYHAGYLSKRHTLPIALAGFGYVGYGMIFLAQILRDFLSRFLARPPRIALVTGLVLIIFLIPTLLPQLESRRMERSAERRVAEWLGDHIQDSSLGVASGKRRTAYYARARHVSTDSLWLGAEDAAESLRGRGANYVIVDEPDFVENLTVLGLEPLHAEHAAGRKAVVFDLGTSKNN